MGIDSNTRPRMSAVPKSQVLDRYENCWVALLDGEVVQAAESSHELALRLHDMDHRKRAKVVIEFVRPSTDAYIVGVG